MKPIAKQKDRFAKQLRKLEQRVERYHKLFDLYPGKEQELLSQYHALCYKVKALRQKIERLERDKKDSLDEIILPTRYCFLKLNYQ